MAPISLSEIFLLFICFFLVLFFFSEKFGSRRKWPLFGMLPALLLETHRLHDLITEVLEELNCKTFLFEGPRFCNMDMLVTVDPSNIHYIMTSNFSNFHKGPEFKKHFDILGDGIFTSDMELWKSQRRFVQALMKRQEFHQFVVKITQDKVEKGLIPVLEHVSEHGLVLDLQDLFQGFVFDATSMIVTGYDPSCLSIEFPQAEFSKAMRIAEETIFSRHVKPGSVWKLQRWIGIGREKKMSKAWEALDKIIAEIISAKKESLLIKKTNNNSQDDELGLDLLSSYIEGDCDDKFLRDTVISLMFAGKTIGSALSWFFYLLLKNPQVLTKIREELKATLPKNEAESWKLFETEKCEKLVYLHGALCESLRLYPSLPFQIKYPLRPEKLPSGHKVSPKMKILIPMYAMGRMSSIWGEDCLEFKPERWITEKGGIKHEPSYKFFAFNAGPRTCLGKELAFSQMKAVGAAIIHNYHFEILEGQNVSYALSVLLLMKHGIKVRLTNRWAPSSPSRLFVKKEATR